MDHHSLKEAADPISLQYFSLIELHNVSGIHEKHQEELDNLTLTYQPLRTLKFFILAVVQYVRRSIPYLLARGGWLVFLSTVVLSLGILLITIDGPHEKVYFFVDYLSDNTFCSNLCSYG